MKPNKTSMTSLVSLYYNVKFCISIIWNFK